jgi:mutator protein MutT
MPIPLADRAEAACALIVSPTERILCVSRKDDPNAWGLPGGKIEPGETPKQAAKRELAEETGLVMNSGVSKLVFLGRCVVPNSRKTMLTATYVVPRWRGEISTVEEGRVGWRTWDDLLKGPFAEYNAALRDAFLRHSIDRAIRS